MADFHRHAAAADVAAESAVDRLVEATVESDRACEPVTERLADVTVDSDRACDPVTDRFVEMTVELLTACELAAEISVDCEVFCDVSVLVVVANEVPTDVMAEAPALMASESAPLANADSAAEIAPELDVVTTEVIALTSSDWAVELAQPATW